MVWTRALYTAVAVPALLLVGIAIGIGIAPRFDGIWVTDRFIAERMAECALTVRLHEQAVEIGDPELERLLAGDMGQCRRLVATYPHQIDERDFDVAARIQATGSGVVAQQ